MRWLLIISLLFIAGCARHEYNKQKEQLTDIRKVNTFEAYDKFLARYPDSSFEETALYYRDQLWVDTAAKDKNRESLTEFLRARPDSAWVERAHYYLENGFADIGLDNDSCQAACHEGKTEVGHANLSPQHREKMSLAKAQQLNTVEGYNNFLREFPKSEHRDAIIYSRDQILVDKAIARKDRPGLTQFIQENPESEWFDRAHYYLRLDFKVAEHDSNENCSECHQNGVPKKKTS